MKFWGFINFSNGRPDLRAHWVITTALKPWVSWSTIVHLRCHLASSILSRWWVYRHSRRRTPPSLGSWSHQFILKRYWLRCTLEDVLFLDFHSESFDCHLDVLHIDRGIRLFHDTIHALHHLHESLSCSGLVESSMMFKNYWNYRSDICASKRWYFCTYYWFRSRLAAIILYVDRGSLALMDFSRSAFIFFWFISIFMISRLNSRLSLLMVRLNSLTSSLTVFGGWGGGGGLFPIGSF